MSWASVTITRDATEACFLVSVCPFSPLMPSLLSSYSLPSCVIGFKADESELVPVVLPTLTGRLGFLGASFSVSQEPWLQVLWGGLGLLPASFAPSLCGLSFPWQDPCPSEPRSPHGCGMGYPWSWGNAKKLRRHNSAQGTK